MKKPFPWSSVLLAVLALSLLGNVALCYKYVQLASLTRRGAVEIQSLRERVAAAQRDRSLLQAMAVESLKYAQHNAEMVRTLAPFLPAFKQLGINVTSNVTPVVSPNSPLNPQP